MNDVNKEIKHVLNVFEDYLTNIQSIDIQLTKYGYLCIMPMDKDGKDFHTFKLENAVTVCDEILNSMVIDYLDELNIGGTCVPKEYVLNFYSYMQKYIEQIPEYEVLLEDYICEW